MFAGGDLPASLPPDLTREARAADADHADHADYVVCADRGLAHCLASGRVPDLIVGDFDSVPAASLDDRRARAAERMTLPVAKDASDLEVALERLAATRGIDRVCVLGVSGGRTDHLLFNWMLPLARDWPFALRLVDATVDAHAVRAGAPLGLDAPPGATLSLLALRRATGVTTRGLRWALDGATLEPGSTRGLSNEVIDAAAAQVRVDVRVEAGLLLAMLVRGSTSSSAPSAVP